MTDAPSPSGTMGGENTLLIVRNVFSILYYKIINLVMQRRNSRLFESGSDSIKRDLFDSFSRTSLKKNSTIMDANG